MTARQAADLAYGIAAIAAHLGIRPRQALYLKESGKIPTFKIGGRTVCARKSDLDKWLVRAAVQKSATVAAA